MLVEHVLPVARGRLVTVRDDAMLLEAAQLLSISQIDLVVVCDPEGLLAVDHHLGGGIHEREVRRGVRSGRKRER